MKRMSDEDIERLSSLPVPVVYHELKRSKEDEEHFRWEANLFHEEVQELKKENEGSKERLADCIIELAHSVKENAGLKKERIFLRQAAGLDVNKL